MRVTWPPTKGCPTFWLTEGMCHYSPVSHSPSQVVGDSKGEYESFEVQLIYTKVKMEHC